MIIDPKILNEFSFDYRWKPQINSDISDYRLLLRKDILAELKKISPQLKEPDILSLEAPPQHPELSLSLSHTHYGSIYGWTQKPTTMGLDTEFRLRIKKNVIDRVCTDTEIKKAPQFYLLWTAKEAAFKALSKTLNCQTVSEITVSNWEPHPIDSYYYYDVSFSDKKIQGRGFTLIFGNYLLSSYFFDSSLS
jgi:4'-phosphopantetheinyl transferase EntD